MSKGSTPRPLGISRQEFGDRFDAIFGKKDPETPKVKRIEATYLGAVDVQATWGGCTDPRPLLVEGQTYEVSDVDVRSMHTKLCLEGIEGRFNSACFTLNFDYMDFCKS